MELALAMTILLVALLSVSATTLRSHTLRRQNRERTVAHNMIRAFSEQIHSASVIAAGTPDNWSETMVATYGPGGSVGNTFDVSELDQLGAGMPVGTITIITDETLTDNALGVTLGMPRDLNGDGAADDMNVTSSARLLPVLISIEWTGVSGTQRIDAPFYIMGY